MKIEISLQDMENILSGRFERIREILRPDFFNDPREHHRIGYDKGQLDKEEEIYQFLRKCGFETDCKHGRPKWSCKECLK